MNNNKICIYAICKNEMNFINKWLDSMDEADYVVILDTGSTDGTYEFLLKDSRVTRVEQKIINPWRFDVARNESMKLIPEDANILVSVDIDELFDPGWADVLRVNWDNSKHKLAWYKYAWRHDEAGNPIKVFRYEKIHSRDNWKWIYPIHENLTYTGEQLTIENVLDVFDMVYLHHYMDDSKSRGSYLELLELRKKEWPNELQTSIYLIQEYLHSNEFLKCLQEGEEALEKFKDVINDDVKSSVYLFMGDSCQGLNLIEFAQHAYKKAIEFGPKYVEQYVALATIALNKNQYQEAISILQDCLTNATQYYVFFTRGVQCSELTIYDLLSVAYFNFGDLDNAFLYISKALMLQPENEQLKNNYKIITEAITKTLTTKTNNSINRVGSPYEL